MEEAGGDAELSQLVLSSYSMFRQDATSRWQTQALDEFNDAARRAARRDGVT